MLYNMLRLSDKEKNTVLRNCKQQSCGVGTGLYPKVKGYGYCFTYLGGAEKSLRGSMTFMRVKNLKGTMSFSRRNEESIGRAAVQLEEMGLTDKMVIVMSGNMTSDQRKKALDKPKMRVREVLEAIEWLTKHHRAWLDRVDLDKYRKELEGFVPVVVDNSKEVDSENSNLENHEMFSCFFPEGAANQHTGGFDSRETFQEFVEDMSKQNCDIELGLNYAKEYANDDDDILVNACLRQFPYGVGGLWAMRRKYNGTVADEINVENYAQHLSRLANPTFQETMLQLVTYSLSTKNMLLRRSRLQLRGPQDVDLLANGLNTDDISNTIKQRNAGNPRGGTPPRVLHRQGRFPPQQRLQLVRDLRRNPCNIISV